jgi:hypothetical protein
MTALPHHYDLKPSTTSCDITPKSRRLVTD